MNPATIQGVSLGDVKVYNAPAIASDSGSPTLPVPGFPTRPLLMLGLLLTAAVMVLLNRRLSTTKT